jgi:hypothetical protein
MADDPHFGELGENPLLLSLMTLAQYAMGAIPERRHLLYRECVWILLERPYAPLDARQRYHSSCSTGVAVEILQGIANTMQNAGQREIGRLFLEERVLPGLLERVDESKRPTTDARTLLDSIIERSQLLLESGFDESGIVVITFAHPGLQEYLCSAERRRHATVEGALAVEESLLAAYDEDPGRWEEVVTLYGAQVVSGQREAFLKRVLRHALPRHPRWLRVKLAGRIALEWNLRANDETYKQVLRQVLDVHPWAKKWGLREDSDVLRMENDGAILGLLTRTELDQRQPINQPVSPDLIAEHVFGRLLFLFGAQKLAFEDYRKWYRCQRHHQASDDKRRDEVVPLHGVDWRNTDRDIPRSLGLRVAGSSIFAGLESHDRSLVALAYRALILIDCGHQAREILDELRRRVGWQAMSIGLLLTPAAWVSRAGGIARRFGAMILLFAAVAVPLMWLTIVNRYGLTALWAALAIGAIPVAIAVYQRRPMVRCRESDFLCHVFDVS